MIYNLMMNPRFVPIFQNFLLIEHWVKLSFVTALKTTTITVFLVSEKHLVELAALSTYKLYTNIVEFAGTG